MGIERSPTALFAPVRMRRPPGNSFINIVLSESLLLASDTRFRGELLLAHALGHLVCGLDDECSPRGGCIIFPSQNRPLLASLGPFHEDQRVRLRDERQLKSKG